MTHITTRMPAGAAVSGSPSSKPSKPSKSSSASAGAGGSGGGQSADFTALLLALWFPSATPEPAAQEPAPTAEVSGSAETAVNTMPQAIASNSPLTPGDNAVKAVKEGKAPGSLMAAMTEIGVAKYPATKGAPGSLTSALVGLSAIQTTAPDVSGSGATAAIPQPDTNAINISDAIRESLQRGEGLVTDGTAKNTAAADNPASNNTALSVSATLSTASSVKAAATTAATHLETMDFVNALTEAMRSPRSVINTSLIKPLLTSSAGDQAGGGSGHTADSSSSQTGADAGALMAASAAKAAGAVESSGGNPASQDVIFQTVSPILSLAEALARRETRTLSLRLDPKELGHIEVRITRDAEGKLSAHLDAETEAAHHALSEGISQLRETLERAGLSIDRLEVSIGFNLPSTSGGSAGDKYQNQPGHTAPSSSSSSEPSITDGTAAVLEDRLLNMRA